MYVVESVNTNAEQFPSTNIVYITFIMRTPTDELVIMALAKL